MGPHDLAPRHLYLQLLQVRSLPVSAMARVSTWGVPRPNLMRYSPASGTMSTEAACGELLPPSLRIRVFARLNDRCTVAETCSKEDWSEGDFRESLWIRSTLNPAASVAWRIEIRASAQASAILMSFIVPAMSDVVLCCCVILMCVWVYIVGEFLMIYVMMSMAKMLSWNNGFLA